MAFKALVNGAYGYVSTYALFFFWEGTNSFLSVLHIEGFIVEVSKALFFFLFLGHDELEV
jgi:hypothetical protein